MRLVCVVTYNRKDVVDLWLRAWNNAEKFGAKLCVLHSHDGDIPDEEEKGNILKHRPDFYVPFRNTKLRDMEALSIVLGGRAGLPEWDELYWFTDDLLPMRRTFLGPFVKKISDPRVGLVAQCYEPRTVSGGGDHIRTVAYAINKDVGKRLVLPTVGREEERPYLFEHGRPGFYEDHILNQVRRMGYEFRLCHSDPASENYQHWTSFLDWMWDCHLLGSWKDMWNVYESQFEPHQPWEGVESRNDCLLSSREFEEITLIRNKVCAIVPTSTASLEYLMWSVLSLLVRSDPAVLEHIIVGINGPDERTGDPSLQDRKQRFVEDLRSLKWHGKDMPVTLSRTWSRVGHSQMLEQCEPWVHTEYYLSMHDDIVVMSGWESELEEFALDPLLALKAEGDGFAHPVWSAEGRLELVHLDTSFSICRKPLIRNSGASWVGYYIPMEFNIGNLSNFEKFCSFHEQRNLMTNGAVWPKPSKDEKYSVLSVEVGGILAYDLMKMGYKIKPLQKSRSEHFRGKSWDGTGLDGRQREFVRELEKELVVHPELLALYRRHI